MQSSPRIFLFINMAVAGGGTNAHALAEDGHMLATEVGMHPMVVMNALATKTQPYWTKYPRGFTLEMILLGEDPTKHEALSKAVALHKLMPKPLEKDDLANVFEGPV